jgi:hypothetical protein
MQIRAGQLFVRDIAGAKQPNAYMVCGIIVTDQPLQTEATHTFMAPVFIPLENQDVSERTRGNGLDGIMQEPIWKVKVF